MQFRSVENFFPRDRVVAHYEILADTDPDVEELQQDSPLSIWSDRLISLRGVSIAQNATRPVLAFLVNDDVDGNADLMVFPQLIHCVILAGLGVAVAGRNDFHSKAGLDLFFSHTKAFAVEVDRILQPFKRRDIGRMIAHAGHAPANEQVGIDHDLLTGCPTRQGAANVVTFAIVQGALQDDISDLGMEYVGSRQGNANVLLRAIWSQLRNLAPPVHVLRRDTGRGPRFDHLGNCRSGHGLPSHALGGSKLRVF